MAEAEIWNNTTGKQFSSVIKEILAKLLSSMFLRTQVKKIYTVKEL